MYSEIQAFSLQILQSKAIVVASTTAHQYLLELSTSTLSSLYITKNNSIALRTSINGVVAIKQRLE